MKSRAMWLITFLLLAFSIAPARAGITLSDNLSATPALPTELASGDTWLASSFTTDGLTNLSLQAVTLLMEARTSPSTAQVDIFSSVGSGIGQPGSSIGTLISPSIGALGEYTFTPSGSLSLDTNTTYWVVLRALTTGQLGWAWTHDNTGDGVGFLHTWAQSTNAGSSWGQVYGSSPFMMNVTAVPEPSTRALFGTAILLFGLGFRRQSQDIT